MMGTFSSSQPVQNDTEFQPSSTAMGTVCSTTGSKCGCSVTVTVESEPQHSDVRDLQHY
jgi:hypothetical protein